MPIVAQELGGIELYGWVFSRVPPGRLVGIAVVGGLDRPARPRRPFVIGLTLFGLGLLIGGSRRACRCWSPARLVQGFGAGGIPPIAYVAIGRVLPDRAPAAAVRGPVDGLGRARDHRAGHQRLRGRAASWRLVFLGLLPFVALAAALTIPPLIAGPCPSAGQPAAGVRGGVRSGRPARALGAPAGRRSRAGRGRPDPGEPLVTGALQFVGRSPSGCRRIAGADASRHPRRAARDAGRDPAARHPHVHLLRRRCVRPARPAGLARVSTQIRPGSRSRGTPSTWTGGVVDPGPLHRPDRAAAWFVRSRPRCWSRSRTPGPGPVAPGPDRRRVAGLAIAAWAWASAIRRVPDRAARGAARSEGAATSALQLATCWARRSGHGIGGAFVTRSPRGRVAEWVGLAAAFGIRRRAVVGCVGLAPDRGGCPAAACPHREALEAA